MYKRQECDSIVKSIASQGGTPLVVAKNHRILGVIHLKDIIKKGVKEKFADLRKMGIKTIMITGDNPMTAAAIAAEAGVDDFLAEATPEAVSYTHLDVYKRQVVEREAPGMTTALAFAMRIPAETRDACALNSYTAQPYQYALRTKMHHIMLVTAKMTEEFGYHATAYTGSVPSSPTMLRDAPVSYTHLDVYKRQAWKTARTFSWKAKPSAIPPLIRCGASGPPSTPWLEQTVSNTSVPSRMSVRRRLPVSYTHLDVYKRQW